MKLEYLSNINNFIKKQNTDHYVRHFKKSVLDKFKRMMAKKQRPDVEYAKIMDDEETIKRIQADINKAFITPDEINNKNDKKSL
jgi:uncharacterized protein (UPF0305 family)|tara:strand:- start:1550 stop:1801 length:252 start_codon:yes stop_codon:yes gene_type:complete